MSDFFKFVEDNGGKPEVGSELVKTLENNGITNQALQDWFQTKGYNVTLQECHQIIEKKSYIINGINSVKGY